MSFNEDFTLIELEQIFNSLEYQDRLPAGPTAESGCDLNEDLNNILSSVRRIIHGATPSGVGNWFDAPSIGISGLHQQVVALQQASGVNLQTWTSVFNQGSGILDASDFDSDVRLPDSRTWFFNDGNGINPIMEVTNSGILARNIGQRIMFINPIKLEPGDILNFPTGFYTLGDPFNDRYLNLEVRVGGQVWAPGSGINEGNEQRRDYRENTNTSIITNRKISDNTRIDLRIYG
jgi:hypothetical protein